MNLFKKFISNKGFSQLIIKTVIFLVLFVIISFVIGQRIVASSLLMDFYIYIYGGMGKILLFSIFGFILLYRKRLFKVNEYNFRKKNIILLIISFCLTAAFYLVELRIQTIPATLINIIGIHALFLLIFIFLGLAIFGYSFFKDFYKEFKRELTYFLIFGVIVYFLMEQVWKLWPYFALIVTKSVHFLLDLLPAKVILLNSNTLQFGTFAAKIAEACSGTYSIFLFTALYLFILLLDWKKFNKLRAILIFVPAVIGAFLVNIFRVFVLMVVGNYISREAALGLYHSYTGMIFFLIYFALFWVLTYKWLEKPEYRKHRKRLSRVRLKYRKIMSDSLYRNSIYLMLNTLIITGLGFFFWMINTRLFSAQDVGLATTLISIMGLITGLSVLGFNIGLIRYLPNAKDKNKKINTCMTLSAIAAIIITSLFLMGISIFSPKLLFIKENIFFAFGFIFFMVVSVMNMNHESIFVAYRSTKHILTKNVIFSILKLVLPFGFVFLGAYGIFASWMIALTVATLFSTLILIFYFNYKPQFKFHDSIIKKIGKYSFGNYIAGFIGGLPTLLLPLVILSKLNPEVVAYYYISMMFAAILFIIPQATSKSLFAEGSYNEKGIRKQVKKSLKIISLLLIPAIIILLIFGKYALLLFGKNYSLEGFRFLQLITISSIFISINSIYNSIFRVRGKIYIINITSIIRVIAIISLSSILMIRFSLLGVGLGWIIGVFIASIVYSIFFIREFR
ncbi:archaeosortase/exosortase family protein [Candidatus Pacearchaeota archaeon]|nr:archaeosortase/exosortase family protein [Candidatus Pacearchaeota archaeon]